MEHHHRIRRCASTVCIACRDGFYSTHRWSAVSLDTRTRSRWRKTFHHLDPRYSIFLAWSLQVSLVLAWVTWCGWVSLLAGVANLTAIILQNLVTLNSPTYASKPWHTVLIIYAIVATGVLVNIFTYKLVPKIEFLAGIFHVCLFVIFLILLIVLGRRHNADYVFVNHSVSSGWTNTFVAWNIGMLTR